MSWFQLDPPSIADRVRATNSPIPSLGASITRGVIGFTLVSLAGFVPWAFFGKWFRAPGRGGEPGMYVACALVFLMLSGLFLHRLILGTGSLSHFYKLFTPAFTAYSIAWIVGWMMLRGHPGSIAGLLAGTALMGAMLALAFDAKRQMLQIIAALFLLNSAGYFIGGWVEGWIIHLPKCEFAGVSLARPQQRILAMMSWGLFYGIGFGAGLGVAFHHCQSRARSLLLEKLPAGERP
jgi:hypothetical protein